MGYQEYINELISNTYAELEARKDLLRDYPGKIEDYYEISSLGRRLNRYLRMSFRDEKLTAILKRIEL